MKKRHASEQIDWARLSNSTSALKVISFRYDKPIRRCPRRSLSRKRRKRSVSCVVAVRRKWKTTLRMSLMALRSATMKAVHLEDNAPRETAIELAAALRRLADWLGLSDIAVERRGGLANELRRAYGALP